MRRRRPSSHSRSAVGLPAVLAAAAVITPLLAAPAAAQTSEGDCIRRAEATKTSVMRIFGGDNVNYGFFRRADRAIELCRSGQIGKALDIVAALKADIRGARNELFEDP